MKKNIRKYVNQRNGKVLIYIIIDILVLIATSYFSISLRHEFKDIPDLYMNNIGSLLVLDSIIMIGIFYLFKLYHRMWPYASVLDLMAVGFAVTTFEFTEYIYKLIFDIKMPNSYYLIQFFLLLVCVGFSRFFFRILRSFRSAFAANTNTVNTMIIGAGDAGRLLINEVLNNPSGFGNKICCVIDDNKDKRGTYIRGIPVVGTRTHIEEFVYKYGVQEIIIAIPSATKEKIALIVKECQKTECEIKILPSIVTMMGEPTMSSVRKLNYTDFLGRNEIVVNVEEISSNLTNKRILVTGGGGSIGSELCRQIAKTNPELLVIFDIYENNAYDIQQELVREYPDLNLQTIIGSVRDYDRLENVFKEYNFDYVYHAAAHKHVPLMEVSPNEAVKNNCLGTLNTCKLADKYKVKRFTLISSDKAVRPTNVMGATKRICEMIIQDFDKKSADTDFVAVRFGNVLGSNGSVIPLFLKQIEAGGPVTVTHKEITRFFMTIPEAVSLVLQASCYAEGGEIFVLDMGEPVKIYDLAKQIIRFKGLEPNVDIKIQITGLRPGEKLYEERLMEEEGLKETPNKLISIAKPIRMNYEEFENELNDLIKEAYKNKNDIKDKVADIVKTYKVDKRENN